MKEAKADSSTGRWILLPIGLMVMVVIGIYLTTGRGYGKVTDRSYKVATALYGACLSKSDARLEKISLLIIDDESTEEPIPSHERAWLTAIVEQAQDGKWESAAKSSKRMMEDQVEY